MKKNVLLIGGRKKTRFLAESLIKQGFRVTAVNDSYEDCTKLAEINKLTVIHGDGTKPFILEDADAGSIDIAIALTPYDEDNLVICELCKKRFGVKETVSLVSDPKKTDFFYKMGINSVVCAISVVSNIIEQRAFVDEMANVIPVGEGRAQITELPLSASSPVAGKKIWEIDLPKSVIITCIQRGDTTIIPSGDTRILAGDILLLISAGGGEIDTIRKLTGRE